MEVGGWVQVSLRFSCGKLFKKKMFGWGAGGGELYPVLFWMFGIFLTLQSPYV